MVVVTEEEREVGNELRDKISFICSNKKNVKHISEYLKQVEEGSEEPIPLLTGVFSHYVREKTWVGVTHNEEEVSSDPKRRKEIAEKKVNGWLHTAYKSYVKILLEMFRSSAGRQLTYFQALLRLLEVEYSSQYEVVSESAVGKLNFPNGLYIKVVRQLLTSKKMSGNFVEYVKAMFVQYDDLCFYCLKNVRSLLENQNLVEQNPAAADQIAKNTLMLLSTITNKNADVENEIFLYVDFDENPDTEEISKSYKSFLSSAWMSLFRLKLPSTVRKKILVSLDTKIMPHLQDPKLLIDFLTDAYNSGGVNSLLALNGLFVLINQYNLDYPEFYTKLYNILDANVFSTKYKARFFYHLDLFLTSTHLPGYLVCAFVKKLARIALLTPGEDLFMLLKFIKNLLIRHDSARILVHRQSATKEEKSINGDPFVYEESDPFKSGASKSCLWELETLRSHYSKDVLKLLFSFKKEFPIVEDDLSQYLDGKDFEELIMGQLDVEVTEENVPPLNCDKKKILDFDAEMWCM